MKPQKSKYKPFHISLRYKLAIPILIFMTFMLFLMFRTTYRTVRQIVIEHSEDRLKTIAEVFAESVRVPMILRNQQVLHANIEWMAKRPDILGVSIEDAKGVVMGAASPTNISLTTSFLDVDFSGVRRVTQDAYAVAIPIREGKHHLGRVVLFFYQPGIEEKLREIFMGRLFMAFFVTLSLAVLVSGLTWIFILPIFKLERTAREILAGNLSARARIRTMDEIQDLAEAFNEMVARLTRSFENLRVRTEALEESEEKYRLIVEDANDVIFLLSSEGEVVLLNKGFSGCTREDVVFGGLQLLLDIHDDDSREKFQDAIVQVIEKKEAITNLTIKHLHQASGTEVFYLANLTPVLGPDKNVKLIQIILRDVTELRRIELMKESLVRDVAHELKTPTSKFEMAVHWFEKEVGKNQDAGKYKEIVQILKNNTERLMRTITSIMDLTKLEAGMDQVKLKPLNLNRLLESVCRDILPLCQQKGLGLEENFCRGPLNIEGDWDMLYRLFINLIGNSIKFTEKGKIKVASLSEEGKAVVSVQDTGIGIAKGDLGAIFERFVQKTPSTLGIGVGLTISRDIAILNHAKIWAESEGLGKGSIFKVQFPLAKEEEEEDAKATQEH